MTTDAHPTFADIDAFYAADERRRFSGEHDYGVWWFDEHGAAWRGSWVNDTGEFYIVRLGPPRVQDVGIDEPGPFIAQMVSVPSARQAGPVVVLGIEPYHAALESRLAGWGDECGKQDSLAWLRSRWR